MAEVIKNYKFNKDKSFVIFDNKYYVVARHLAKLRELPDGVQIYNNDQFMGYYGRIYFKYNQIQVYQDNQEVAYCKVNDNFFNEITANLPEIKQWSF